MKAYRSTHPSVYLLCITFGLGILFTLCSLFATSGGLYTYGGIFSWLPIMSMGLKQEGVLYLDATGFIFALIGSFLMSILSLLTLVFTLIAHQRGKLGKRPMIWSGLLLGVALFVLIGSSMAIHSLPCTEDGGMYGSDDTVTCTIPLHPAIRPSLPTH